jgi:hypothetical protein
VDGNYDLYFQRGQKYGIQEFLVPALEENPESEEFGSFINNQYFESPPKKRFALIHNMGREYGWGFKRSSNPRPEKSFRAVKNLPLYYYKPSGEAAWNFENALEPIQLRNKS